MSKSQEKPAPLFGQPRNHKTLTEETLWRLRRDIISGTLPAGGKIKSDDIKHRYNVGTSPIREALFQLVTDGLVTADGQRGFRVAELRETDLLDIADWRARLESEALRRSIEAATLDWEAHAIAAFHRMKRFESDSRFRDMSEREAADTWEEYHREFHFALYSTCGSPWLLRFCELLIQHGERYRRAYIAYPRVAKAITQEHEALLEAALARDTERAVDILEKHIRHAANLALQHAMKRRPRQQPAVRAKAAPKRRRKSPSA